MDIEPDAQDARVRSLQHTIANQAAELARLRKIEAAAREFIASEDLGPFDSAVSVRTLRKALDGPR